jgi:hypothetical protein
LAKNGAATLSGPATAIALIVQASLGDGISALRSPRANVLAGGKLSDAHSRYNKAARPAMLVPQSQSMIRKSG